MPCIKCSNGKWKYGQHGRCQFDALAACKAAEAAIHARENPKKVLDPKLQKTDCVCQDCKNNSKGANNGNY